ncbi:glycerophosphoryl diester phosphodiesterase [Stylonychia lemnae]|uniref:glycerophosphodiester phosphodiesterase n=1 Tax=Stylonychia lemnae TaxID=5949 RepID=A0A078AM37_STYLE|nr:glycerophosphoryl diester phosphodiesterase [Stylonychia lemnae]|eukprot:CDW82941.1 glycerophosphoryl diester phosphodiesterase [Stylonychia lemnae]
MKHQLSQAILIQILLTLDLSNQAPLIIAHRGAFGYFPEHTFPGYEYAFYDGADFIDIDVQPTKDGHLVAHHEPSLDNQLIGTEQHPEIFRDELRKTFINPLTNVTYANDFMLKDFNLEELKLLRRVQRYQGRRSNYFDGLYQVLSLQEAIDQIKDMNEQKVAFRKNQIPIGIYIEIKQTDYYLSLGIDVNGMLLEVLKRNNIETNQKSLNQKLPVMLQSFYLSSVTFFQERTDLKLSMNIEMINTNWTIEGLIQNDIKLVSIQNTMLAYPHILNNHGMLNLVNNARQYGIEVHVFTAKDDIISMKEEGITLFDKYKYYYESGIDGLYTEHPRSTLVVFEHLDSLREAQKSICKQQAVDSDNRLEECYL